MQLFDLPGPKFLVVYLFVGIGVLLWLWFRQKADESGSIPKLQWTDPYLIAFLRAGANEARRIAVVSLIDRGLLTVTTTPGGWLTAGQNTVKTVNPAAVQTVKRPIERAILQKFLVPGEPKEIFDDSKLDEAGTSYEVQLQQWKLLPNSSFYAARLKHSITAILVLWGIAFVKLYLAIIRGHSNVGLLIVCVVAFSSGVIWLFNRHRTYLGDAAIEDIQQLFAGLKSRASDLRPGRSPNELALAIAVFGLDVLSAVHFPYAKELYPQAPSGTSCGTGCGSACGGGGCGGGCGGCGG